MSEKKYDDRKHIPRGKHHALRLDDTTMSKGVEQLNKNKVGAPSVCSDACLMAMALFRNTVGTAYRQLQGVIEEILGEENSPTCSAICKRISKISLEDEDNASRFSDGRTKTGTVSCRRLCRPQADRQGGDWMGQKWGAGRGLIKMHIMADSDTKKIHAASITDEKSGDAPGFRKLPDEALQNIGNSANVTTSEELSVGCDGAYDTNDNFGRRPRKRNAQ